MTLMEDLKTGNVSRGDAANPIGISSMDGSFLRCSSGFELGQLSFLSSAN